MVSTEIHNILIVQQSFPSSFEESDLSHQGQIDILERTLKDEGGVKVKLVKTFKHAQQSLQEEEITTVVFISRSMLVEARAIKDQYPKVRVVVFTALLPRPGEHRFTLEGLILVDKIELASNLQKVIKTAILGT